MVQPLAVVAGASGMVGYRIARYVAEELRWSVVGLSRKSVSAPAKFSHLHLDLLNQDECRQKLRTLVGVSHLFYAARYDHNAVPSEPVDTNLQMLVNVVNALDANRRGHLRHVHLVHGTKYYGAPYGRYKTPSKENDPRTLIDTFYYAQQDFITDRQEGRPWAWSISRPQSVSDHLPHIARSIPWGIAVYATICREKGLPLAFPGSVGAYSALYQCTEATHLAKAAAWMASERTCRNEAFNVTNGDYFRWENLWPKIAEYFGLSVAPPRPMSLAKVMPDLGDCWSTVVEKHRLDSPPYENLVAWSYLDFALGPDYDRMSDLTKLRKFGFHDVVDTEEMFMRYFDHYRERNMIPG